MVSLEVDDYVVQRLSATQNDNNLSVVLIEQLVLDLVKAKKQSGRLTHVVTNEIECGHISRLGGRTPCAFIFLLNRNVQNG
jgi:hypothetical protein